MGVGRLHNSLYLCQRTKFGSEDACRFGNAFASSPELIFLDEPTLGLDVLAKQQMIGFLKRINRENHTTIIVTSHDMDDLEEMAKRIVLLLKGKIAFDGSFEELRKYQGSFSRLSITAKGLAPQISGLRYLESKGEIHQILGALALYPEVVDLEIKQAPIEEVIAALYRSWRQ